jgi:hypothetical protein
MMSVNDFVVIGADPGPRPGVVALRYSPPDNKGIRTLTAPPAIIQCTSNVVLVCIRAILPSDVGKIVIGYELFEMRGRTARTKHRGASEETSHMCGQLKTLADHDHRIIIRHYKASDIKSWAIDERLDRLGLLDLTKGMTHARDGARVAVFTARQTIAAPDPLSKTHRMEIPA